MKSLLWWDDEPRELRVDTSSMNIIEKCVFDRGYYIGYSLVVLPVFEVQDV